MAKFSAHTAGDKTIWINVDLITKVTDLSGNFTGKVHITFDNENTVTVDGNARQIAEFANRVT